jgi:hypothetical protein
VPLQAALRIAKHATARRCAREAALQDPSRFARYALVEVLTALTESKFEIAQNS